MLVLFGLLLLWQDGRPDFILVANQNLTVESINRRQLHALYLKRSLQLSRQRVIVVQYPAGSPLQTDFERWLFGKRFDVRNYWYEQQVQGGEKPPLVASNEADALIIVSRNPGYLCFVPARLETDARRLGVKVLELKD